MDKRNDLLKRREVQMVMQSDTNPGFDGAKKKIMEEFKASDEDVVVKFVKGHYGRRDFLIEAFIYDSKEDLEKIEPRKKEKKAVGQ
jgi:ribosomal protein S24E